MDFMLEKISQEAANASVKIGLRADFDGGLPLAGDQLFVDMDLSEENLPAGQRIAIMGSMNELGESSAAEHEKIGKLFHPDMVEWVITIGEEAEKYLAPAAHANGCQVKSFASAVQAGAFAHSVLDKDALVLVKGSQGGVYAEEAVKILLLDQSDVTKLVRQSPAWMATKEAFFERNLV